MSAVTIKNSDTNANLTLTGSYQAVWSMDSAYSSGRLYSALLKTDSNDIHFKVELNGADVFEVSLRSLETDYSLSSSDAHTAFPMYEHANNVWVFKPPVPLRASVITGSVGLRLLLKAGTATGGTKKLVSGLVVWGDV